MKKALSDNEILNILKNVEFIPSNQINFSTNNLVRYTSGFINETVGFQDFIVKINTRDEFFFLGNQIISSHFARLNDDDASKVVQVLDYDPRQRTPYEVLAMRRSEGSLLERDLPTMSKAEIESVFRQSIRLMNRFHAIQFDSFGEFKTPTVEGPSPTFGTASEFLARCFNEDTNFILRERLADSDDIEKLRRYFKEHVPVFDACEERPCFVHRDVHFGNILHRGNELTAIIDFDMACSGQAS